MAYLLLKYFLSATVIVIVNEVARRSSLLMCTFGILLRNRRRLRSDNLAAQTDDLTG